MCTVIPGMNMLSTENKKSYKAVWFPLGNRKIFIFIVTHEKEHDTAVFHIRILMQQNSVKFTSVSCISFSQSHIWFFAWIHMLFIDCIYRGMTKCDVSPLKTQ